MIFETRFVVLAITWMEPRLQLGRCDQTRFDSAHTWHAFGQMWSAINQTRLESGQIRLGFGQLWPDLAMIRPNLARIRPNRARFVARGRFRPNLANFGPNSTDDERFRRNSARARLRFGATLAGLGRWGDLELVSMRSTETCGFPRPQVSAKRSVTLTRVSKVGTVLTGLA